tara:strand:+ start:144 stop:461 length:318 start_codon:yes stop_codon:yes gene_type:complete
MNINHTNKQAIHELLITDLQRRLFKQYNERKEEFRGTDEDYDVAQTLLIDRVLQCNNMRDINELTLEYCDLFTSYDEFTVATVDGTLNYVLSLLVDKCDIIKFHS